MSLILRSNVFWHFGLEGTNILTLAFLTLSAFATAIISGVLGMAGGIVLLSLMTFVMPVTLIIPIHGCVQLVSNSSRALMLFPYVKKNIFLPFIVGLPLGTYLSLQLIKEIKDPKIFLLGIAVVIFVALFKPKKLQFKIPLWSFAIVGVVTGFLALLVGATGPFLAAFFLRDDITKEELVATKASVQFATHVLKIPAFLSLGFDYSAHWITITTMIVAVLAGTKIGVGLLKTINEKNFVILFRSALFLSALRLLYKVFL